MTGKRRISHKGCRAKGHGFERKIANEMKEFYPDARRHLEYQKCEAKGFDVANTGPFLIQCKRNRLYAPITKINEVKVSSEDQIPILVTKGDNLETMCVMKFSDFLKMLRRYCEKATH